VSLTGSYTEEEPFFQFLLAIKGTDLSSLLILRTIKYQAQKSLGKQIHKPMEYTFLEYFHFCLVEIISGNNSVEIHSSKAL